MRTIFFGATELGYRCCEGLIEKGHEIVAIFSIPRRFRISYAEGPVENVTFRNFENLAERHGIPLIYIETKMSDPRYQELIADLKPDFGLAAGWYYVIPRSVLARFDKGVAGVHASLLPKYRGGAPLVWAIINGETKTGVTLFYFDDGVDTGDIIAQREFPIAPRDTIREVYERATQTSVDLAIESIPLIASGKAPRAPQDESGATVYPQRSPEDGLIDWRQDCETIRNFIRAQTRPYPGAFTILHGKKVTIWDADISDVDRD